MDGHGFEFWGAKEISLFSKTPDQVYGLLLMYNILFFLGVKRRRREPDHLLPSNTKVKNEWSYTSIPRVYLRGMYRGNFTFKVWRRNSCILT